MPLYTPTGHKTAYLSCIKRMEKKAELLCSALLCSALLCSAQKIVLLAHSLSTPFLFHTPFFILILLYVLLCVNIFFYQLPTHSPKPPFSPKGGFKDAGNGSPAVKGLLRHILAALRYSTVPFTAGALGLHPPCGEGKEAIKNHFLSLAFRQV